MNRTKIISSVLTLMMALLVAALPAVAAGNLDREVTFSIESQTLDTALLEFSKQANVQLMLAAKSVGALHSPGISGKLAIHRALASLLEGTGLKYTAVGNTVTIEPAIGSSGTGATHADPLRLVQAHSQEGTERSAAASAARSGDEVKQGAGASAGNGAEDSTQEIIVTATKRAERLQDVPSSIAVLTKDEIEERGLFNAEDYLRGIPGANQAEGREGQSIIIRGIESATIAQNLGSGPTTATYFGETPTTNSAGLNGGTNIDLKLVDIERVEVLRGPQGTAFGNSSLGGAVRTIPVAPKLDRIEGKVAAGYSFTSGSGGDNHSIQAVGNVPLVSDKFAIRATAYRSEDSGFYRNIAGSDAAFQAAFVVPFGAQAFAIDEDKVGSYYVMGGRVAALFQTSSDLRFTLSYLSQKTERDGVPQTNNGSYEQTLLRVAPEHVVRGQELGLGDTQIGIANATMEYDLGWANLLATYSYIDSESMYVLPFLSYGLNWAASSIQTSDHREHVGEIRLATQFEGPWNFLAGLYAEQLKDQAIADSVWHGDPARNILSQGLRELGTNGPDSRSLKQKAAFGEASWKLLPQLTLTGGIRFYEFDRIYQLDQTGFFYGGAAGTHVLRNSEDSGTNLRANLSYKPSDSALLYAGWSQGFRLGRLQGGLPVGACDPDGDGIVNGTNIAIESTRIVDSDELDSYEIGAKFELLGRRLTIAADVFRMEWTGMPVRVRPLAVGTGSCGGLSYFANAGEALSEGAEFQANFQITDAFRADFGGSWTHARLTEDVPALNAFKGNQLPGSPEVSANFGLQYRFGIGNYNAFVRADSIYAGSFYGNLQESPNTESGDYVKLDISTRIENGTLGVDLYVRNVTNDDAFTFRGDNGAVGTFFGYRLKPRTVGLQIDYAF